MIQFTRGNIIESQAEALVNTVNTVGVMGKGIALQFKENFDLNYRLYKQACNEGKVAVGKMFVTSTNSIYNPKWIINFPTKKNLIVDKPILDSRPIDIIYTRKELSQEVFDYVEKNCTKEEKQRLEMIKNLIQGYESPFGLELLATVEWVIQDKKSSTQLTPEVITSEIQNWSKRKSESFTPELIEKAINHLNKVKTVAIA